VPGAPARLADAPGVDAAGAGRAGVVVAGRGALAVVEPGPGCGADDRFSTGAGRGAVQPASSTASANAASWPMAGSGLERTRQAVRVFKSVV